ncbi:17987_t:CDS:2 [Entrophospora sp. SA101]|nr:17987_t:CDS:2 [Entrophospora sp. SA101]
MTTIYVICSDPCFLLGQDFKTSIDSNNIYSQQPQQLTLRKNIPNRGISNNFDLTKTYEKFVQPYKEKDPDSTLFPYIKNLPGKLLVNNDKTLRKVINKPTSKWEDKFQIDGATIEKKLKSLYIRGPIQGFNPSEIGLEDNNINKTSTTSSTTINHHLYIQGNCFDQQQIASNNEGEDKLYEKKKKKKHKHDEHDGKRRHRHDKDGGEYKKKKRKKDRELTAI